MENELKNGKNPIYRKWWFWAIIVFVICILIILYFLIFNKGDIVQKGVGRAGISKNEFEEINLGMKQSKVEEIIDKLDEWNDDEIYNKCVEEIGKEKRDKKYIYTYKYYGEKRGYAIITYEADYSSYYTPQFPEVIKKEKFDLE